MSAAPLALVTGGAKGIGFAIAERLSADGFGVALTYHGDEAGGRSAAERLGAKRSNSDALRSGAGAALGFVLSGIVRFGCGAAMVALFLAASLRH